MDNNETQQDKFTFLDGLYHNVKLPTSFSSAKKLLITARNNSRSDITLNDIKEYLTTQPSYTKHGFVPRTYRKSQVIVHKPGILLSSDLADFSNLKEYNDGYCYLVIFIDCYSRKLHIVPVKDKKGETIAKVLDNHLNNSIYHYSKLWIDRGKEYYNKHVQKICEKHNLKMYSVHNYRVKAAFAERVIRTIKTKLYKIFTHFNTYNYINYLDDVVTSYNSSQHTGLIGLTPDFVHTIRDEGILYNLTRKMIQQKSKNYGSIKRGRPQLDRSLKDIIPVKTHVRLLAINADHIFNKSYLPIYTEEVFIVDKVNLDDNPITYTLRDLNLDLIEGRVYRNELKITEKPTLFDIEKIIRKKYCKKTKKHLALVKFVGYPDSHNMWLDVKDLVNK